MFYTNTIMIKPPDKIQTSKQIQKTYKSYIFKPYNEVTH